MISKEKNPEIKNIAEALQYIDGVKEKSAAVKRENRAIRSKIYRANKIANTTRGEGQRLEFKRSPFKQYDADAVKELMDIIGKKNRGISFNPVFNSKESAEAFIEDQIDKAQINKDKDLEAYWRNWRVQEADLDNKPNTIDNIVVFSDFANKRIKAIDGYSVAPRQKKERLRAYYSIRPTREERKELGQDPEEKKWVKAYIRKYPDRTTWGDHDFDTFKEEFEANKPLFQLVKEAMKGYMEDAGLTLYSRKQHYDGVLYLTHYMTLLQKLSSAVVGHMYKNFVDVPGIDKNYNWVIDPDKFKTKKDNEEIKNLLMAPARSHIEQIKEIFGVNEFDISASDTFFDIFVFLCVRTYLFSDYNESGRGKQAVVEQLINEINNKNGTNIIEVKSKTPVNNSAGIIYNITDFKTARDKQKLSSSSSSSSSSSEVKFNVKNLPFGKNKVSVTRTRRAIPEYERNLITTPSTLKYVQKSEDFGEEEETEEYEESEGEGEGKKKVIKKRKVKKPTFQFTSPIKEVKKK
jgi:hypothetical protein